MARAYARTLRLFRELGPHGFLTFQLIVGGNALVALAHPFLIATLIYALSALMLQDCNLETLIQRGQYVATAAIGYSHPLISVDLACRTAVPSKRSGF